MLVRLTSSSRLLGVTVALILVVVETLLVYPLQTFTMQLSPSVIYMIGIMVVSMVWGMWLGVATALASVLAFLLFYVQPIGRLADSDIRDVVELGVFVLVAVATSALADLSRLRTAEAQESDLTAEMARLLLNTDDVDAVLPAVARRIAHALELPDAVIEPVARSPGPGDPVADGAPPGAFPLRYDDTALGTLWVPTGVSDQQLQRLRERVVPALASLLHTGRERESMINSLATRGEALQQLAGQQTALRRVATLVAHGVSPAEVFDAITAEVSRLLDGHHTTLLHYEPDGTATIVSTNQPGLARLVDKHWPTADNNIAGLVRRTGRAARVDTYADAAAPTAARTRELGIRSAVGVPIVVENQLWGTAAVTSMRAEPMPPDAEARIQDFTDLAATAIANTENRAQLIASRARIVTAADEARRRIERDLHDGAQQQLVALSLELRAAEEAAMAPGQLQAQLAHATASLNEVVVSLRELARGIHPAVLATGGLKPALKALARRSAVPVDLHLQADHRLPAGVEMAAYYVVSESLTNAAKHAHASVVNVDVRTQGETLQLVIHDDGVGGADPERGSGITGLLDRVETLGGRMTMSSPPDAGTSLLVTIPIGHADQANNHQANHRPVAHRCRS